MSRNKATTPVYPVRLYFTRQFTQGNLQGLTHDDELGFMSVGAARAWVRNIQARNDEGACDYRVIAYQTKFVP